MSRPEYEVQLDRRVRVPMRDGVELARRRRSPSCGGDGSRPSCPTTPIVG